MMTSRQLRPALMRGARGETSIQAGALRRAPVSVSQTSVRVFGEPIATQLKLLNVSTIPTGRRKITASTPSITNPRHTWRLGLGAAPHRCKIALLRVVEAVVQWSRCGRNDSAFGGALSLVTRRMRSKNAFDGGLKRIPKRLLFGPQTNPGFHAGEVVVKVVQLLIALRDRGGQRKGGKGNGGGKRPKGNSFHGDTLVCCLDPAFAEAGLV
jgi:hypothetical protein